MTWSFRIERLPDGTFAGYINDVLAASGREETAVAKRMLRVWSKTLSSKAAA